MRHAHAHHAFLPFRLTNMHPWRAHNTSLPSRLLFSRTLKAASHWRCVTSILLFSRPSHFHSLAPSQDKKMKCQGQEEPSLRFSLFLFLFPFKSFAPWKCHFSLGVSAWHDTYRWSRDCPVPGPDGVSEGRFCAQPTESKVDSIAIVWIGIVTFRHWKRIGENERDSLFCYPSVRFQSCGAKCQTGLPTDSPIRISNNWSRNVLIFLNKTIGGMIDIMDCWYRIFCSTVIS